MSTHHHVLLTLFNIRYTLSSDLDGLSKWTDKRFPLFEQYCFPSIKAQTNQNFDWLIIIDPSTSTAQRKRLQALLDQRPRTYLIEYEDWDLVEIPVNEWLQKSCTKVEYVITSRVDNDDVLHQTFMEEVRATAMKLKNESLINYTNGYCLQIRPNKKNLLYQYDFNDNSFMSFVEPMQPTLKTIRKYNHNEWPDEIRRVNIITETPLWMQLIHGNNVRNRIWGRAVHQPTDLEHFQLINLDATYQNKRAHHLHVLRYHLRRPLKKIRSLFKQGPY